MKNFIKIMRFLKPYWFIASMAPIFLLAEVTVTLLIPKTSGQLIDYGIKQGDLDQVKYLSLLMLLYTLLSVVFSFLSNFFANWASAEMSNDLRIATFSKSLNMSFINLDEFEIGKVITRVTSDSNSLRFMTRNFLRTVFKAPYMLFGAIFIVIGLSPKLAFLLILIVPILFISNFIIIKKSYPKYREIQEKLETVNTFTQENLENIRVVKAFNRSEYANNKFEHHIEDLSNTTIKANIISSFNTPIFMFIMNMCIVAVLWFGGMDVINGDLEVGNIVAFLGYLGQISGALAMITSMMNIIPRAATSSTRILELLNVDSELQQDQNPIKTKEILGKIEFRNVSFNYKSQNPSLKNLSFIVNPGERLGVLGTTGSGKTTLINLIPRFYDTNDGEILIDDIDVKKYDLHTLRSQISTVMQKALLFAGTIEDNIKFGDMECDETDVLDAAKNAEAFEFITNFNEGYQTILGERGINLSGGQKQRLSMARSLLPKPKIIIFDDSTSAVDMTTESKILSSLNKNVEGATIIIIAQRIRSVMNCDRILILENGKITGYGTHQELLKTSEYYRNIYQTQMGVTLDE